MDLKVISELIRMMGDSKLSSLEVESKDLRIKLEKSLKLTNLEYDEVNRDSVTKSLFNKKDEDTEVKVQQPSKELNEAGFVEKAIDSSESESLKVIKSPIVGTFYSSASPESKPFAEVGKTVKKGETLCIIEAMKLMNEIESEFDGEIIEILAQNGAMVEYGQPLFKLK
jgi:acetyl-CoA carboxylase biotin carboxyl carrier protein